MSIIFFIFLAPLWRCFYLRNPSKYHYLNIPSNFSISYLIRIWHAPSFGISCKNLKNFEFRYHFQIFSSVFYANLLTYEELMVKRQRGRNPPLPSRFD